VARVAAHYGISVNKLLREPAYGSEARNVAIWLAWQNSDLTLREIGSLFGGLDYAAVSQRIRRVQNRAERDKKLKQTFQMLNV
jgi:chromosomal replication initiation ATPase DnaA